MEGNLTAEERAQLSEAAETYSTKEWEEILEPLAQATTPDQNFDIKNWEKEIQFILSQPALKPAPVIPLYRRTAFKWIAAAAIIIMAVGGWWMVERRGARGEKEAVAQTHDVPAPTNTRAVITLADGSKVYLDSASNGTIAQENNVAVVKNSDGSITYSHEGTKTQSEISYNTMFNPRGSKAISLTLSDGTKVWLNSESSLRYPASFAYAAVREVEITGEAYFEVQHNAKQPFKVHLPNGAVVEDLGTAFNINAYADAADIKTTLIKGSVKISAKLPDLSYSAVTLKPGEQSVINRTSPDHQITRSPDIEEVTAWKNGRFSFTDATIENILKEISRYYDAEIVYQDKIPGEFVADISRDVPVSKLLHILELTNRVHFKIEGKRITVMK
jgi:ferric-dicitrate binding protein FerR (iron transport regulator)